MFTTNEVCMSRQCRGGCYRSWLPSIHRIGKWQLTNAVCVITSYVTHWKYGRGYMGNVCKAPQGWGRMMIWRPGRTDVFSCDQEALWMVQSVRLSARLSVCLSVCPSVTPFWQRSCRCNFRKGLPLKKVMSMQKVKVRGQMSTSQKSKTNLSISEQQLEFELTYGDGMMHRAWCGLGEVPYYFSRSSVNFQSHRGQKRQFWPELSVSRR